MLRRRLGAQAARAFLADLADGRFQVDGMTREEHAMASSLHDRYVGLDLGLADLSLIVLALTFDEKAGLRFRLPGMWDGRPQRYGVSVAVRCFIVDDNRGFLDAVQRLLDGDRIHVVGTASTTREALEQVHRLRPDVALVDMVLGDESGLDVARGLTEAPGLEELPVILISTYEERDFADLIAASSAVGFLSKSELSESAVLQILDRRGTP
jgi:CheY-like chemotaxis protein